MMKIYTKKVGIELFIIAVGAICALVLATGVVSAADIFVGPGETYTTIQSAVTAANPFDTIIVRDGTYTENVNVTVDNLTIQSENGSANCIVNASDSDDHVFSVTADWVNISGFTVQGSAIAGIYLNAADHCTISENTVSNNVFGIYLASSSNNNTLTGNTASYNTRGIYLYQSSNNNTLTGNTASNNNIGIYLNSSSNNLIYNNYFDNTNNAHDNGNNIWNISQTPGTNIVGGSWLGGNYWSDYTGEDTNGDELGNTVLPYNSSGGIENGGDWLPLVKPAYSFFDTGEGTYPSISGTHNGTITPSCNLNVSTVYTYPCAGTGGHTKSIDLYENDTLIANGTWNGYKGDWYNITITPSVTLWEGRECRYVITTGSYPQIIHEPSKEVTGGTITCDEFTDVNGRTYTNWIPAILLE